jgi:mono/diheme cytochrome c family protein
MMEAHVERKRLAEKDAADLFAYFYSSRYFDRPGDAARGKQAFSSKRCAECHGIISQAQVSGVPPVSQWKSLGSPIDLAEAMWNHGSRMRQEFQRRNIPWQELTSQNLTDILVYLRNLPSTRRMPARFATTSGDKGAALFEAKGCAGCHKGKLELAPRLKNMTITDVAVAMWNHQPKMAPNPPVLEPGEMNEIVSHLWAGQFFANEGNPGRGKSIFAEKGCAGCHGATGSAAPDLTARKGSFTSVSMVSGLWGHGPAMLEQMRQKNIAWPRFTPREMSDLIAFLNSPR